MASTGYYGTSRPRPSGMNEEMDKEMRVLIIEDSEEDTLLMVRNIERGGYKPLYARRVETAEAMRAALREETWDVILCDYSLPHFSVLAALALAKETGIDLPFIIVSGTIGEETAVESMKAGAHDYVMKDRLQRLVPAIRRELKDAADRRERQRTEKIIAESEERFRLAFDNANIGMNLLSPEGRILRVNQRFCDILGYGKEELEGRTILEITHPEDRPASLSFLEAAVKGGPASFSFEKSFLHKDGRVVWGEVTTSLARDASGVPRYFISHVQDVTERRQSVERLRTALGATVQAIATVVETRDPYTAGHQRRVAELARSIAEEMGLSSQQIDAVRMASLIHDIGKLSVPAEILSKPIKLTGIEFSLIKTHPQAGYTILKDIEFPGPVARVILEHHERMDGSGYPEGLKGEEILLESRILQVSDVVESMASHRPYRPSLGIDAALEEITRHRGTSYDASVVDVCLRLFREKNFKLED